MDHIFQEFSGSVKGLKVEPVDTTGAGDAFVSETLAQLASDLPCFSHLNFEFAPSDTKLVVLVNQYCKPMYSFAVHMEHWPSSIPMDEDRLRDALKFANVCGALTLTERGAIPALATREAVLEAILKSVA
ncbi:hypothetical protein CRYUN_Cryun01aG0101300 [Craigia yunnanensis]